MLCVRRVGLGGAPARGGRMRLRAHGVTSSLEGVGREPDAVSFFPGVQPAPIDLDAGHPELSKGREQEDFVLDALVGMA
jgi:hypothetical protein